MPFKLGGSYAAMMALRKELLEDSGEELREISKTKKIEKLALNRFVIKDGNGKLVEYNKGVDIPIRGLLEVKARQQDLVTYFPRGKEGVLATRIDKPLKK